MAAYGLYTHIASNKFRSMLLLAGLFVLVYVMVYAGALIAEVLNNGDAPVDYYLIAAARDLVKALPYATGGAALWIVIAYFFHQSIVDAVTGGEDVTRRQQPRLYNLLENLCISRGIPMPKLKIIESDALNAYATGLNTRQYAITVTSGLLNALNDQEVDHRRRGRLLRRIVLPKFHQFWLLWRLRRIVVVLVVVVILLLLFFWQRPQKFRRRRDRRDHYRGGADRAGLAALATGTAGAVALARTAGRRRIG
jgi:ABC-type multidrug transport system fused ATPase/permease subunit